MKKIIVALLVAFTTPSRADDLGDFIRKLSQTHGSQTRLRHLHPATHHETGIHQLVTEVAATHHLRPSLVHAVVKTESGYKCGASSHGSKGIMQVKPATAASMGVHGNLFECRTGLEAGARYLKRSIVLHGDNCVAYSAFNSGLGAKRCTGYGRRIQRLAGK